MEINVRVRYWDRQAMRERIRTLAGPIDDGDDEVVVALDMAQSVFPDGNYELADIIVNTEEVSK